MKVPELKLQEKLKMQEKGQQTHSKPPEFLRLHMRRSGLRGKLTPLPVLKTVMAPGGYDDCLTVPVSLAPTITRSRAITVSCASAKAFRWYRLRRSGGSLFSTVASIIGGLLVGLGAAVFGSGVGKGLLIAGAGFTILAAAVLVISAWRAPVG